MGKAIPIPRYREIGHADGHVEDVAARYGVAKTTVYNARSFVARERIRADIDPHDTFTVKARAVLVGRGPLATDD